MKNTLLAFSILSITFFSCKKETKPLSKEEIRQQIDSVTAYKINEIDKRARIDLQHRIKIEVKAKVDSILNARMQPHTVDTSTKKNAPPKL